MSRDPGGAVGGYFGLELPPPGPPVVPGALRMQSARACLAALLAARRPARLRAPAYICDSMLLGAKHAGVPVAFYGLDRFLQVGNDVRLEDGEVLLYVNYFGISNAGEEAAIERFGADRVILDRSQALFAPFRNALATLYSPRKFLGVPDGGLLLTRESIAVPAPADGGSVSRSRHLLLRHDGPAQAGHAAFREAERTLDDPTPRAMSALTARILDSVDLERVRRARNANFAMLHSALGEANALPVDQAVVDGPLCYPFLGPVEGLRDIMVANQVFVPTYWPEVAARAAPGSVEEAMVGRCLPIPCDQRYGREHIESLLLRIKSAAAGRFTLRIPTTSASDP